MDKYAIISPKGRGSFAERLLELYMAVGGFLDMEGLDGRRLQGCKIFLSDIQNQYDDLLNSFLFQDIISEADFTVVGQPPLDGSKIAVLVKTSDSGNAFSLLSVRLKDDEARGKSVGEQATALFNKYGEWLVERGLALCKNCLRTWVYVADIDNNYAAMVTARNDFFARHGMTKGTHFIASTGIEGETGARGALVGIDFLTCEGVIEGDKRYLTAPTHLNPTHEYGVAFERGTRVSTPAGHVFFISGTASIGSKGEVLYVGEVLRQAGRLLENIGELLKDGGATMNDVRYFVVYLRDASDYSTVEAFMNAVYTDIPHVILQAKVCRPAWLIEMECVANVMC